MKGQYSDYSRLKGSKIYYLNIPQPMLENMVKTFEYDEIGVFMSGLYYYIHKGVEQNWQSKKFQTMWKDVLTKMNEKADGWFKWKEEQEYKKILNEDNNK